MIELRVLGTLELKDSLGTELRPVLAQPKRLALLAYLATAWPRQFRRRDVLVSLFWPELDDEHARTALRQAAHFLRRSLGAGVVTNRGEEELGIDGAALWCDAAAFEEACERGRVSDALALYRGDLLPGLFISDAAPEFEHWLDVERDRLRRRACEAAWTLAEQDAAQGDLTAAAQHAHRAASLAPDDEGMLRRLITVLDQLGDRAGAVRAYEKFAARLAEQYEVEPSVETKALIEAVRSRRQRASPISSPTPPLAISGVSARSAVPPSRETTRTPTGAGTARVEAASLEQLYAVEREVGQSGVVTIYRARDLRHGRPVMLKVLHPSLAAVLGVERFVREIRLLARLQHPHIHALYDSGEVGGTLYYVMPAVEGETLRDRLARERQLPVRDALAIALDLADVLAYAHSHGVLLRDLKPETILLCGDHAVVTDFGIARAIDRAGGERLTETGVVLGTPAYMSPEQARGERDIDGRSDIYSLGCVLYEMLAGEPPFTGPKPRAVMVKHQRAPVPHVSVLCADVPKALDALVFKALAKDKSDRFANAAELVTALRGVTSGGPPARAATRPRRWRWR